MTQMILNKLGLWQHGEHLGVLSTADVLVCLGNDGKILAYQVDPSKCRFVGYSWTTIINKLLKSEEQSDKISFDEVYLSVKDTVEELALESEMETLYTYDGNSDETTVNWCNIPIELVYEAVLSGNWETQTDAVSAQVSYDELQQVSHPEPRQPVNTLALGLSKAIHTKLIQEVPEKVIDTVPT